MTIEPLSTSQATDLARRFFQEGHRTWPRPLIYALEQSEPELALKWAIQLYQELLAVRGRADSRSRQQQWLDELGALLGRNDVADHCDKVAYEAWERDTAMNVLDRGIARLYWSLKNYLQRQLNDYYFQVTGAVGLLADTEKVDDKMDDRTLEYAIALCRQMIEDPKRRPSRQSLGEDGGM
jgi:hypothetical protein